MVIICRQGELEQKQAKASPFVCTENIGVLSWEVNALKTVLD